MAAPKLRTTIELKVRQRAKLLKIASERGLKGFSPILQEAVDYYIEHYDREARETTIRHALALRGTLTADESNALEITSREIRSSWR